MKNFMGNTLDSKGGMRFGRGDQEIYISAGDMELIHKLRILPVQLRIAVLSLTRSDVEIYIREYHASTVKTLLGLVKIRNWKWGDTAERVVWEDVELTGKITSRKALLKELKAGGYKLTVQELQDYIDWFAGSQAEIYC